jgi:osmoprotectant transport system substrate-binding protein
VRPRSAALAALAALVLAAAGCGGDDDADRGGDGARAAEPVIRIGTKNFTEQYILGELYRQALRAKGFRVQLKSDVGSTEIIHQALTTGGLDMYPEYIGVLLSEVAKRRSRPSDPHAAYAAARAFEERRGFTLLGMTPFSDQNALAVSPALARRHKLRAIGDLARVPGGVRVGAPPEFRTRFEGIVGLRARYGLRRVTAVPLAIGKQYGALDAGRVGAAAVFTTDGELAGEDYVLLRDPRGVFATQRVAPIVSRKAVRAHGPRLAAAVDAVSRTLTTPEMRKMNAAVVLRKQTPAVVAAQFLRRQRLLGPARQG